ncbi:GDP/GTP exchange factor for ARF [Malassezia sp. CBS 17886]|nr:GDP/GTP exchange factor for ARF [Malassezia sp. CBS 17886]
MQAARDARAAAAPAREARGLVAEAQSRLLHLVVRHITTVTSAMRSSPRWALAGAAPGALLSSAATSASALSLTRAAQALALAEMPEYSAVMPEDAKTRVRVPVASDEATRHESSVGLLGGFTVLRAQLRIVPDVGALPLPTLLAHFLRVVVSPRTTGAVTQAVLEALTSFLHHGLFRSDSVGLTRAVQDVAHAVSHCRFEPSDPARDEVVLLAILDVMHALVCGHAAGNPRTPLVNLLGDASVCEMMETCLSMCCQARLSSALRRTAEQRMLDMLRGVYAHLESVPLEADAAYSSVNGTAPEPVLATLTAEPVGLDADMQESGFPRMAMPDPKSMAVPGANRGAGGGVGAAEDLGDGSAAGEAEREGEGDSGASAEAVGGDVAASGATATDGTAAPTDDGGTAVEPGGERPHAGESALRVDAAAAPREPAGEPLDVAPAPPDAADAPAADPPAAAAALPDPVDRPAAVAAGSAAQDPLDSPPPTPLPPPPLAEPFGLPALTEVLRVLTSLLDPHNARHTAAMRMLGQRLLGGLLETHGDAVARFPTLRALLEDSACRFLIQLLDSDNAALVGGSLRVLLILFRAVRTHLKLQQELFLLVLLQQLAPQAPVAERPWEQPVRGANADGGAPPPRPPATGELRELFLDALSEFLDADTHDADLVASLWQNYDCDLSCTNVYEELVFFLARAVIAQPVGVPPPAPPRALTGVQLVALDALLGLVGRMAARCEHGDDGGDADDAAALAAAHARKQVLAAGAAQFNAKPKDGVAFLERAGLLNTDGGSRARARSIARFLKESPRVDKRLLGDYLSRPDNLDVLGEFIDLFDFSAVDVAEAMRALCEAFRLPGEAQQIARVTETFARAYYATRPVGIRSEDAVYVLAYSIILLNTDLHNPQVTRRMTIADYQRNLRGVNDGADFEPAYLATIYDGIRRREIVMPEEHAGQLGFDYIWKELLRRARAGNTFVRASTRAMDRDMFQHSWRAFVAAIVRAFTVLHDEHLLQRVITACRQCAMLARAYDVPEVFDVMVTHFASATGLLDADAAYHTHANVEHRLDDAQTVTVSPLAIQFGADFKHQLAAVVLFNIANGNGAAIRDGWAAMVGILECLLPNALLPAPVATMRSAEAAAPREPIPLRAKRHTAAAAPSSAHSGLLSTLSSYFLAPYAGAADPLEVTPGDLESALCTLDCLASCRVDELHAQLATLPPAAHAAYARALQARLAPRLADTAEYAPATLFLLDQLVDAASADRAMFDAFGRAALTTHESLVQHAARTHPLLLERAVAGALCLVGAAVRVGHVDEARARLSAQLALLQTVPAPLQPGVARAVLGGLDALVGEPLTTTHDDWVRVLHVAAVYAKVRRADAVRIAVRLGVRLIDAGCTAENYAPVIELLRELVSAADRALWLAVREGGERAPRRTLTEKRELGDWEAEVQARCTDALAALHRARVQVPALLAHARDIDAAWPQFWLPLLASLAQQCVNAYRPARQAAVSHLQHVLLSPELLSPAPPRLALHLDAAFSNILFPLMDALLKPEMLRADLLGADAGAGIAVTRVDVCLLLCKAWARFATVLAEGAAGAVDGEEPQRVLRLWTGVLGGVLRVMQSGVPDSALEAVGEQLINTLLVMHACGLLVHGGSGGGAGAAHVTAGDDRGVKQDAAAPRATSAAESEATADSATLQDTDAGAEMEAEAEACAGAPAHAPSPLARALWDATWCRVDPVRPNLRAQVFPPRAT